MLPLRHVNSANRMLLNSCSCYVTGQHSKLEGKHYQPLSFTCMSSQMPTIDRGETVCHFFHSVSTVKIASMEGCGISRIQTCDLPTIGRLTFLFHLLGALINNVFNASPVFLCLVAWFLWLLCALAKCLFTFPVSVFPTSENKEYILSTVSSHTSLTKGFLLLFGLCKYVHWIKPNSKWTKMYRFRWCWFTVSVWKLNRVLGDRSNYWSVLMKSVHCCIFFLRMCLYGAVYALWVI